MMRAWRKEVVVGRSLSKSVDKKMRQQYLLRGSFYSRRGFVLRKSFVECVGKIVLASLGTYEVWQDSVMEVSLRRPYATASTAVRRKPETACKKVANGCACLEVENRSRKQRLRRILA